jgi:hypothetical protein
VLAARNGRKLAFSLPTDCVKAGPDSMRKFRAVATCFDVRLDGCVPGNSKLHGARRGGCRA